MTRILQFLFISLFINLITTTQVKASVDPHTLSNIDDVKVSHMSLDLTADFEKKRLSGSITYSLNWQKKASKLVLDSSNINIGSVTARCNNQWKPAEYTKQSKDEILGEAIHISVNNQCDRVKLQYHTSQNSKGLQWLEPPLTAGKKHPFLFTQSEAIMGRSWLPMQDTPAIKLTYDARIQTPKNLRALMSADFNHKAPLDGSFSFTMNEPVAPYLIALAVGDLHYQGWSKRSGVWAEPVILEAAAKEFEDTEAMIVATENVFGPYPFGQYDLLILPPSFPFGGMENPKLTFVTPTVIAGDKSLVSLISHELAHSWSGNLVTNARWQDLWLNEGTTSYLENRILEDIYGAPLAKMEQVISYQALLEEFKELEPEHQGLVLPLTGIDPDEAFTDVPYTKGQLFFLTLEQHYGRKNIDSFLKNYFKHYAFKTITTPEFVSYLQENLLAKKSSTPLTIEQINEWLTKPGLPETHYHPSSEKLSNIDHAIKFWKANPLIPEKIQTKNWTTQEFVYFLTNLPKDINAEQIKVLDKTFKLTNSKNAEISLAWFPITIHNDYRASFAALAEHFKTIGRRRLIVPLYKMLAKNPSQCEWGASTYQQARSSYHPLTQSTIDKVFDCKSQEL